MDINIHKTNLIAVLATCAGIANKNGPMPVLACVRIEANSGGLVTFSATDLYRSVQWPIAAEVLKPGVSVVHAKDLFERIKVMPDGPVRLSLTDEGKTITIGTATKKRAYRIAVMPDAEYPAIPVPDGASGEVTFTGGTLGRLIGRVVKSASEDTTRAHVNSVLLRVTEGTATAVATDGHRMAIATCETSATGALDVLLALPAAQDIVKLGTDTVTVTTSHGAVFLRVGAAMFSAKIPDGQFPPYEQVIPDVKVYHGLRVNRAAFSDATSATAIAADSKSGVTMTFAPGTIAMKANCSTSGDGVDEVDSDGYTATPVKVGLGANYVVDALRYADAEDVQVYVRSELDPVLIIGDNYKAIVMPMRI